MNWFIPVATFFCLHLFLLSTATLAQETKGFNFESIEQLSDWKNLEQLSVPIACTHWNSEKQLYEGATLTGDRALLASGQQLARLGGDYWIAPIPFFGQQGHCRLDTWYRKTDHLRLISPEFTINRPFISFLLNGGDHSETNFKLQIKLNSTWQTIYTESGSGVFTMKRFNWKVEDFKGNTGRFLITDRSDKLRISQQIKKKREDLTLLLKERNERCKNKDNQNERYLDCLDSWQKKIDFLSESPLLKSVPWLGIDDIRFSSAPIQGKPQPVWGAADLHLHLFTEYAFGGGISHGKFNGPMSKSLAACKDHGLIPDSPFGHDPNGYPKFSGWPNLENKSHHQAHVDWLHRSWKGGLRLIMMDASNNEFLRVLYNKLNFKNKQKYPSDDQSALELQIEALMKWLSEDKVNWAQIALTPPDARRIISQGKLAIVPGVEMDRLAKQALENTSGNIKAMEKTIKIYVKKLKKLGIRHVFPIHGIDNHFGGAAVFERAYDVQNRYYSGQGFQLAEGWHNDIRFRLDYHNDFRYQLLEFFAGLKKRTFTSREKKLSSHVNQLGLTEQGQIFIKELMKAGLLIDLDHMSELAKEQTISLAKKYDYPLMVSHTRFRKLAFGWNTDTPFNQEEDSQKKYQTANVRRVASERTLSEKQALAIKKSGGVIGLMLGSPNVARQWDPYTTNNCDGSSSSFFQSFSYLNHLLDGQGVTIGSDFNGYAKIPGPRFGSNACYDAGKDNFRKKLQNSQAAQQSNPVIYLQALKPEHHYPAGSSSNQNHPLMTSIAGYREFDFNREGMVHYGLLPDFWQDMANISQYKSGMTSLFQGAEHVIRMWEKAEKRATIINSEAS